MPRPTKSDCSSSQKVTPQGSGRARRLLSQLGMAWPSSWMKICAGSMSVMAPSLLVMSSAKSAASG